MRKINIETVLVSIISAIVGSLLTTRLTAYFSKNNEIETRIFDLKVSAYQTIVDNADKIFSEEKSKEFYFAHFKNLITKSGLDLKYLDCAIVPASHCKIGNMKDLKYLQTNSFLRAMNDIKTSMSKLIEKYEVVFPQKTVMLMVENSAQETNNIRKNNALCLSNINIDCDLSFDLIILYKYDLLALISNDIQKHY